MCEIYKLTPIDIAIDRQAKFHEPAELHCHGNFEWTCPVYDKRYGPTVKVGARCPYCNNALVVVSNNKISTPTLFQIIFPLLWIIGGLALIFLVAYLHG